MPKIFKPGHIVQFEDHIHGTNVDGFLVPDKDIAALIYAKYGFDGLQVIGLNDGQTYTMPESRTAHCQRVKGKVKAKGEFPTKYSGGNSVDPGACHSKSPKIGDKASTWLCEREAGHSGDHMAWEEYPHTFYKGGVWPQEKQKVKQATTSDLDTLMESLIEEEENPF